MPIVTPISHLSTEKSFFKKILKFGVLEVRDNSNFKGYESIMIEQVNDAYAMMGKEFFGISDIEKPATLFRRDRLKKW